VVLDQPQDASLILNGKIAPVEANSGRRRYEVKEELEITEEQYEVVTS
jgi:hypothetical protein